MKSRQYGGIPLGGGVYATQAWIPNKGLIMWYDLSNEDIKKVKVFSI